MILGLLPVRAVANLRAVELTHLHGGGDAEGNPLIGRPKEYAKVLAEIFMNGLRIILTEALQLRTGSVKARIYKKRGLSSALCHKVPEFQDLTVNHKFYKFLLVLLHLLPCSLGCQRTAPTSSCIFSTPYLII